MRCLDDMTADKAKAMAMMTETVAVPRAHEGVGNALRACFTPRGNELPADMCALLTRLG
jgi:hypothetical protein